jgi:class 3 adenylate cyclase
MAVVRDATGALGAAIDMRETVDGLPGAHPQLRAGLHSGRPRRMNGDYLGADVNIAARISEAAKAGEVLAPGAVLASIREEERERLEIKRRRAFRAKGAPPGLEVFCVAPRRQG